MEQPGLCGSLPAAVLAMIVRSDFVAPLSPNGLDTQRRPIKHVEVLWYVQMKQARLKFIVRAMPAAYKAGATNSGTWT